MQSRRDQVAAYRHQQARLVSGLVCGQPDPLESPVRRDRGSLMTGLVAGVLAVAVAVGLGAQAGPSGPLPGNAVLVDSADGSRYVVQGGALHPLTNLTSAQLLAGRDVAVRFVAHKQLTRYPRGRALGIPGAPDTVPAATALNRGVWQACAASPGAASAGAASAGAGSAGAASAGAGDGGPRVLLALGDLGAADRRPSADAALLVSADGSDYLIWRGRRLRLPDTAMEAMLGYSGQVRTPVPARWIGLLPSGPDLVAPTVPGFGEPGPILAGRRTRVGQVFRVTGAGGVESYYRQQRRELVSLTALDALLAQADPRLDTVGGIRDLPVGDLASARPVPARPAGEMPAQPPRIEPIPAGLLPCVHQQAPGSGPLNQFTLAAAPPADLQVRIPAGQGALLLPAGGGPARLVADDGVAYPLPDPGRLGYRESDVLPGLQAVLDLLPTGPTLSAEAALASAGVPRS